MPDLQHTLEGHDLGFLRMLAGGWGIEAAFPDAASARSALLPAMLDSQLVNEVTEALPADAAAALQALLDAGGRLPWVQFARRFGEVQVMGPARRDRERPDLHPTSPAERLWYLGLLGRAFFNLPPEPQEYAYIPDDLAALLRPPRSAGEEPPGRPASPGEVAAPRPANDRILDHATTLLAALRSGEDLSALPEEAWGLSLPVLQALLQAARLVSADGRVVPEHSRPFLTASRGQALAMLVRAWLGSAEFNELRLVPGLDCQGDWKNNPLLARQALLDLLGRLPAGRWWNLASFVQAVKQQQPDFQRPAGDYDSWFIRDTRTGTYLRGFASWDAVDGALLRFFICTPLHALGLVELAAPEPGAEPAAFRLSAWCLDLLDGRPPQGLAQETEGIRALSSGRLLLSALTPRTVRYQVARFCQSEGESAGEYRYRVTPASLERAHRQGLQVRQFIRLLEGHKAAPVPPSLLQALRRWERDGLQAVFQPALLLRLADPAMAAALRAGRAARFLGEQISPNVLVVLPGGEKAVREALAALGYLAGASPARSRLINNSSGKDGKDD